MHLRCPLARMSASNATFCALFFLRKSKIVSLSVIKQYEQCHALELTSGTVYDFLKFVYAGSLILKKIEVLSAHVERYISGIYKFCRH